MPDFSIWMKVVTHPLGLAAFALFLAYVLAITLTGKRRPSWLTPVVMALIFACILGGLVLAYLAETKATSQKPDESKQTPSQAERPKAPETTENNNPPKEKPVVTKIQRTEGDKSPIITDVKGDVTLSFTDSAPEKEPKEK